MESTKISKFFALLGILKSNKLIMLGLLVALMEFSLICAGYLEKTNQSSLSAGTFATLLGDYLALILPIEIFVYKKVYDLLNTKEFLESQSKSNFIYFLGALLNCNPHLVEQLIHGSYTEEEKYTKDIRYIEGYFRNTKSFIRTCFIDILLFLGVITISATNLPLTVLILLALMIFNFIKKYYKGFLSILELDEINFNFKSKVDKLMTFLEKDNNSNYLSLLRQWNIKFLGFFEHIIQQKMSSEKSINIIETYIDVKSHELMSISQKINDLNEDIVEALFIKEDAMLACNTWKEEIYKFVQKTEPSNLLKELFEASSKKGLKDNLQQRLQNSFEVSAENEIVNIKPPLFHRTLVEFEMCIYLELLTKKDALALEQNTLKTFKINEKLKYVNFLKAYLRAVPD